MYNENNNNVISFDCSQTYLPVACCIQLCYHMRTGICRTIVTLWLYDSFSTILIGSSNSSTNIETRDLDNTNQDIEMSHDIEASYESFEVVSLSEGTS